MLSVRHLALIRLLLLLSGSQLFGAPAAGPMSPDMVRAIRFLTSDKTLLSLIRAHDLVKVLNAPDEESAMFRLRRRTTIEMEPDGNGLVIGVEGQDPAHSAALEDSLVELWHRESLQPPEHPRTQSEEELTAGLEREEKIVMQKREHVMRIMRDLQIVDTSFLLTPSSEMTAAGAAELDAVREAAALAELPLEYQRARRAWAQQLEVLNVDREIAMAVSVLRDKEATSPGSVPPNFTTSVLETAIRPVSASFQVRAHSRPVPGAGSPDLTATPAGADSAGILPLRLLWPRLIVMSALLVLISLGGFCWWQWTRKRAK